MKPLRIAINGGKILSGTVKISGAKNAALPELAASLLCPTKCVLSNVPMVEDINNLLLALKKIGAQYQYADNGITIEVTRIIPEEISDEIAKATRASILLLGPLLARNGYAKLAYPGGCSIGERKINYHLEGLEKMGARIATEGEYIIAHSKKLRSIEYHFPSKTVTGTENLLMAAALAEGETVLHNCALEPEVVDLANLLADMGADINGIGLNTMVIKGKNSLSGTNHSIIPDRIEAGTYLLAGCFPGNCISIDQNCVRHLDALIEILRFMGFKDCYDGELIRFEWNSNVRSALIKTEPYPGFPTDLQAQLTTLLTQVEGKSMVVERIFEDRFKHVKELNRMGAKIEITGDTAVVHGRTELHGTTISTTDLRASAALVLAGLIANGQTIINNAFQLMRGYECMPEKLKSLGADINIL